MLVTPASMLSASGKIYRSTDSKRRDPPEFTFNLAGNEEEVEEENLVL